MQAGQWPPWHVWKEPAAELGENGEEQAHSRRGASPETPTGFPLA